MFQPEGNYLWEAYQDRIQAYEFLQYRPDIPLILQQTRTTDASIFIIWISQPHHKRKLPHIATGLLYPGPHQGSHKAQAPIQHNKYENTDALISILTVPHQFYS